MCATGTNPLPNAISIETDALLTKLLNETTPKLTIVGNGNTLKEWVWEGERCSNFYGEPHHAYHYAEITGETEKALQINRVVWVPKSVTKILYSEMNDVPSEVIVIVPLFIVRNRR